MNKKWVTVWAAATAMLSASMVNAAPAPADIAIHNKQQILYWLEKRGELAADASDAEKQQALANYLARKSPSSDMLRLKRQEQALRSQAFIAHMKREKRLSSMQRVSSVQAADADITKTVRVLAILIDFPDLPHDNNRLTRTDTNMYYADYTADHYQGLLFSDSGYPGPSGQTLQSAYQYYQAASGESFYFTGDVKGWFTADHNADYYGANDPDNDDNDIRAVELVEEAITKAASTMSAAELAQYDQEDPYDVDGDGNLDEPDGIIDHVMVFHSSIGEEAGGGVLGDDAIWSHRFFVEGNSSTTYGKLIPGTSMRMYGYTIQPVDAAVGVCVHEFGHDLGLPDEYDSTNSDEGSPVGEWSLMASGSWTGQLPGAQPSGFSPYARSFLQDRYKGRWVNELELNFNQLTTTGTDYQLVNAANADDVNQIAINLPQDSVPFDSPYQGSYQYYSGQGNQLSTAMSFELELPADAALTLQMRAKWDTELDYDYAQVLVDGVAIAGNHTKASNPQNNAANIITGQSRDLADADSNGWVGLTFDLSAYAGQNKQISIIYRTDPYVGGTGLQLDNLQITSSTGAVFADDAEQVNTAISLNGFSRISNSIAGEPHRYLLQLRNFAGNDSGLRYSDYDPGVLVWYENHNIADNEVTEHPGYNLIGVVDADQDMIGSLPTDVQLRDAALSMYNQSFYVNDFNREAIDTFNDLGDYSAPERPSAGLVLPALGVEVQVTAQDPDSGSAMVHIRRVSDSAEPTPTALAVSTNQTVNDGSASFSATVSGGTAPYRYAWNFGDGSTSTDAAPTHDYRYAGNYTVVLIVTDADGAQQSASVTVDIPQFLTVGYNVTTNGLTVQFTNTTETNIEGVSYGWNFGDGTSSSSESPSHTYAAAGSYTVVLTVTDSNNEAATHATDITVVAPSTGGTGNEPNVPTTSSSSSGGSLGGWSIVLLALCALWRRTDPRWPC